MASGRRKRHFASRQRLECASLLALWSLGGLTLLWATASCRIPNAGAPAEPSRPCLRRGERMHQTGNGGRVSGHGQPLSFFRTRWDPEPSPVGRGVLTAPRAKQHICDVRGGLRTARPAFRFMESEHLQNFDVSWGHEPEIRNSFAIKSRVFRFMGSFLSFSQCNKNINLVWQGAMSPGRRSRNQIAAKHPASNIEHPTFNEPSYRAEFDIRRRMFGVGCLIPCGLDRRREGFMRERFALRSR